MPRERAPSLHEDDGPRTQEQAKVSASAPAPVNALTTTPGSPDPIILTRITRIRNITRIRITEKVGDLFASPAGSVLIHACNGLGSWGVGIALAFRERYPAEFRVYRAHCAQSTPDELLGTALLVPTQPAGALGRGHYIGFLFTSRGSGMGRPDSPSDILRATGPAMKHLMRLIAEEEKKPGASAINELRMCRINTGLFAVPWPLTKAAIQALVLGDGEVPGIAKKGILEVVAYEKA